jgi:hypothetical protein
MVSTGRHSDPIYGSEAEFSVYEPSVGEGQSPRFSSAFLAVQNGAPPTYSMIMVGWDVSSYCLIISILFISTVTLSYSCLSQVNPQYYGDDRAHFEIVWVSVTDSST